MTNQLALLDPRQQLGLVAQHSVQAQNVGYQVVGEHGQALQVAKAGHAGSVQIGGGDLGSFEEWDGEPLVGRGIGERVPAGQPLD